MIAIKTANENGGYRTEQEKTNYLKIKEDRLKYKVLA